MDTARASPLKTLLLVGVVAAGAALLVTTSHELSKERILENQRAELLRNLYSVLDPALQPRDLVPVRISATDPELLGSTAPVDVFIVRQTDGQPVAAIFATIAPEGYNAPIRLLVGVSPAGTLTGIRVVSHRETPGLGDAIELRKSDWILQFDGASLDAPPLSMWAVDKDGGAFDSITGATITPRAVVKAVRNTLLYFQRHRDELFERADEAARAGSTGTAAETVTTNDE